jgi:outer membrane receptor protein involved in Fe transport
MQYHSRAAAAALLFSAALHPLPAAAADRMEEIVVTADLRERSLDDVPASISILDSTSIEQRAVQHFEELTYSLPNLNWSGDGHRARYFQIRGVGELEQYQGAPNPSVGVLIDDIDFSGIGTIATLWDIERIEVLRGPQGTRYGANAIGGLIYMQSRQPGDEFNGRVQLLAGGDDARSVGLAAGGPVGERLGLRLSAHRHESNGFRTNPFLDRDDTNGRDETTLRGRLTFDATPALGMDLALMYTDVNNGYDAFALDNSYTMLSDRPGRDAQESVGASLRFEFADVGPGSLTAITAYADSDIEFGFDADWGNEESWAPITYDYISSSERNRKTLSQEFRLASDADSQIAGADWLVGVYALRLEEALTTVNTGEYFDPFFDFADSLDDRLDSDYTATNLAAFGEVSLPVAPSTAVSIGLRLERRETDYQDSSGLTAGPAETMLGGSLSLTHLFSPDMSVWANLSRGYKAGGFNLGPVPPGGRNFDQEGLWNLEFGVRKSWADNRLELNASVFGTRRDDQQVRTSVQLVPGDPTTFVFFTDNAAKGDTLGLEAEFRWRPRDTIDAYFNMGLLRARFDEFSSDAGNLDGRDQAHAPRYTLAAGARYTHPRGMFVQLDATAKDEFYFDVSHDQRSQAYELVNARLGYAAPSWSVTVWARNLLDERYAVRGFFFGNEPPDFPPTLYTRLGDARQIGVTFDLEF